MSSNVLLESFLCLYAQGLIQRRRLGSLRPSCVPTGLHNMYILGLIAMQWPLGLQNSCNSLTVCLSASITSLVSAAVHLLVPPSFTRQHTYFGRRHVFFRSTVTIFCFFCLHCFCFSLRILIL